MSIFSLANHVVARSKIISFRKLFANDMMAEITRSSKFGSASRYRGGRYLLAEPNLEINAMSAVHERNYPEYKE